jgi:hypothetical protein
MELKRLLAGLIVLIFGFVAAGCSGRSSSLNGDGHAIAEAAFCSNVKTYSGPTVTVSGTAVFNRFNDYDGVHSGLYTVETLPIRHAEVLITDSSGTAVQCGETNDTGGISMVIPQTPGTYTLQINSRADSTYVKVSVLNNPSENKFYSIKNNFTVTATDTTVTVPTITAPHTGTLEGGAFNIFEDIVKANEFLRNHSSCSGCTAFTVAPMIRAFWTPGFNPGTYIGFSASNTISYFMNGPSYWRGLYINGGYNGGVCGDTDHFDNSVIVHEYGHVMEDQFAISNSPGGQHDGNSIIDPRLAWSEGWADFFQAAVLNRNVYTDTSGQHSSDCGFNNGVLFASKNMETKAAGDDYPNSTGFNGEGIYREFSIARTLYDVIQTSGAGDGVFGNIPFANVWRAFSDPTLGLKHSSLRFRNSGMFFSLLNSLQTINANVISNEVQAANTNYYATPLSAIGTCSDFSFSGNETVDMSDSAWLLLSNRYFHYFYDGSGPGATVRLKYKGSGTYDLDLVAFPEDHDLEDLSTAVAVAEHSGPESSGPYPGLETINLSGKAPGHYLINVRANYTGNNNPTNFYLENGSGVKLCP